jgi:hypothetical protein
MWINERRFYNGESIGEGDFGAWGHYTQVIWPETTNVGMAAATSATGGTYIVGRYSPVGNVEGLSAWRAGSGGSGEPDVEPRSPSQGRTSPDLLVFDTREVSFQKSKSSYINSEQEMMD